MNKKVSKKNISAQIMSGYIRIIALIVVLAMVMIVCLFCVKLNYSAVSDNQDNRSSIQTAIAGHYLWLDQFNTSIQTGETFAGSLDHTACSFGKWFTGISHETIKDEQIKQALDNIVGPHENIHGAAQAILDLSKTNKEKAYQHYIMEIKPQTADVIKQLSVIDECYAKAAASASALLNKLIIFATVFAVVLTLAITVFSIFFAKRVSLRISRPIAGVSEWAERLSLGINDLEFDMDLIDGNQENEVGAMVKAFGAMAQSIEDNVNIVRRVADGDMTAFVNIRSSKDSLGQNIYRMVQANDMMFNEIVEIAHTVATGSDQIAMASQMMAESANVQATAIMDLSATITHASNLIAQNNDKTQETEHVTLQIKGNVQDSNEKMILLVQSMESIQEASENISGVIKSIDSIAFETNILALNAAIEAARAGEAGKGFAIVADEVRALAMKSAKAANESKALIEDSIRKTREGNYIAGETSTVFSTIIDGIDQIVEMTQEVASSSKEQLQGIEIVNNEIAEISKAVSSNAAISQESAASSQEMNNNAEILRKSMSKFTLRQRSGDSAYIPPEKSNDIEFINKANEAYQRTQQTGSYENAYIDPQGKKMESLLVETN